MENNNFYSLYLKELEAILPYTDKEEEILLNKRKAGDMSAVKRLIEGNLSKVLCLVKAYEGQGISVEDLVQEGNMALTIAISEFQDGDFGLFLEKQITMALAKAIETQKLMNNTEEEILAKINVLQRISTMMAEELGREATLTELAEKMKMPEEEIRRIMKLTVDAITVDAISADAGS